MRLDSAKKLLYNVKEQKQPIAYKKFNSSASHRRGMGPGRYPIKAAGEILSLLESAEANAQFKGLNTNDLIITQSVANEGSRPHRYGRQRRRKAKRTHVTIVVAEDLSATKGEKKKETPKAETKKDPVTKTEKTPTKTEEPAKEKPKAEEIPKEAPKKKESQGDKKE
jgi:large subunit ribosomal protein L22